MRINQCRRSMKSSTWVVWGCSVVMMLVSEVYGAQVKLLWNAPSVGVADGYSMYRYTVAGGVCGQSITPVFELVGMAPVASQPSFVDNSPVIGANYYHVTAYNVGGESLPSNQVCFQGVSATTAPQNLRVAPPGQ